MAGAPNTRMMPPITAPAMPHLKRPIMAINPRKITPIIAINLAQVLERRFCSAVRKFVPESKRAVCACAVSGVNKITNKLNINTIFKLFVAKYITLLSLKNICELKLTWGVIFLFARKI